MNRILGIDLGTTNSLGAVFVDGEPQLIPNALGKLLTPSVVAVLENGQVIVGDAARDYSILHPHDCAARFKQWMGAERDIALRGRSFSPPELSGMVLRSLKGDAERFLGAAVTDAVITVPAYFNDHQRRATKLAGKLAELNVRRIINEPTAAALTYGFHDRDSEKYIVVLDLGGGTFDVTLMEVFQGSLEIVATAGENFLGGEEFTDRLAATVFRQLGVQIEQAELTDPLRVARLRQACEQAKRGFATSDSVAIRIPDENGEFSETAQRVSISSAQFAEVSQPLLDRLRHPIQKVLRDADRPVDQVDEVILVGGATRMALLKDFVREQLACEPRCEFNPDEVVALGAAIQGALIGDDVAVEDMVMTDVCPHTLGVEAAKEIGSAYREGYFVPIIHRNTTIPVSREEIFYTLSPNQAIVNLRAYQGESRFVAENLLLGELQIKNIPPGPAGTPIVVRFTYDPNGILEIEAFVQDSAERFATAISSQRELSDDEVSVALERMQAIKFYPRDDQGNRHLLHFAERMVGESSPLHRSQLEDAIDAFEHALVQGDPEYFKHSKDSLLHVLSLLGLSFEG